MNTHWTHTDRERSAKGKNPRQSYINWMIRDRKMILTQGNSDRLGTDIHGMSERTIGREIKIIIVTCILKLNWANISTHHGKMRLTEGQCDK